MRLIEITIIMLTLDVPDTFVSMLPGIRQRKIIIAEKIMKRT
jgi:hypothetical protein